MRLLPLIAIMFFLTLTPTPASLADETSPAWHDTFYQYRLPIEIEADAAGWHTVPLTPQQITAAINTLEEMPFDATWFAYGQVQLIEIDAEGKPVGPLADAGFHLIPGGEDLLPDDLLDGEDVVDIPVDPAGTYVLSYTTAGGRSPLLLHEPVFPVNHAFRKIPSHTSFEPEMMPVSGTTRDALVRPNHATLPLTVKGPRIGELSDLSLREADIEMLVKFDKPGVKRVLLYYQPITGHYLSVPTLRRDELPTAQADARLTGVAEKYLGHTRYALPATGEGLSVWFADTTVKLTPHTPAPGKQTTHPAARVSTAANEVQSFQLVVRPTKTVGFERVRFSEFEADGIDAPLPASIAEALRLAYVPITKPSFLNPVTFRGAVADPLVPAEPDTLTPTAGNAGFWITLRTPAGTAPGTYRGTVTLEGTAGPIVAVPIELTVRDFELPEYSPFRSGMGGAHLTKTIGESKSIADYHRVHDKPDVSKLAGKYFDVMARNKFTPQNVAQYTDIGLEWTAPPQGMNIDAPGNTFKLHDWDFTELNKTLTHYIDGLKVNNLGIVHTNPSVITMFKHLPGEALDEYNRHPPHSTLDWQNWREATLVGYDKREGQDPYEEITQAQFDDLVMQFYRAFAQNLDDHGWLDTAYIFIDETHYRGYEPFLHYMRLLKSDPLTARIRFAWCVQNSEAFTHRANPGDPSSPFEGLLDTYIPEINECRGRWQRYYFEDYGIENDRDKIWNYCTTTSRVAIDTPGINNRAIALEVFNNGGSGFVLWASFIWDSQDHQASTHSNPWEQPYTRWGNGAMSYFYPPSKAGMAEQKDFTITPSLRVMTYRESVDDYEYAWMLEQRIAAARAAGRDVSAAQAVLDDVGRFFINTAQWSQNDAWYLDLRDRIAEAIVDLQTTEAAP